MSAGYQGVSGASGRQEPADATVIVGVTESGKTTFCNAAVAWDASGRIVGRYEKVHRAPFSEYILARGHFRQLSDTTALVSRHAVPPYPAAAPSLLVMPAGPRGVVISYEVSSPTGPCCRRREESGAARAYQRGFLHHRGGAGHGGGGRPDAGPGDRPRHPAGSAQRPHRNCSVGAERAATELRASGETARRRDVSTATDLTAQERQVAALVRQGLSNRDAAAQLFVSPRTIDFNLRNVFSKVGVASRTELTALPFDVYTGAPVRNRDQPGDFTGVTPPPPS